MILTHEEAKRLRDDYMTDPFELIREVEEAVPLVYAAAVASPELSALQAENGKLITALAACRDAFPVPKPNTTLDGYYTSAMADPLAVPEYVGMCVAGASPARKNQFMTPGCGAGGLGAKEGASPVEPRQTLLNRATDLHEKAQMPWSEAEKLALDEAGITFSSVEELIGNCARSGVDSLLTTPNDIREFTRAILVHSCGLAAHRPAQQSQARDLHPETESLVQRFSEAMANKLAKAEKKYGYTDDWKSPHWMDECRTKLMEHVAKGDPLDVAAYCAFLWHHGESTRQPSQAGELSDRHISELKATSIMLRKSDGPVTFQAKKLPIADAIDTILAAKGA